jgi:putative Mg2+ transporter-C (MgtC) family protein
MRDVFDWLSGFIQAHPGLRLDLLGRLMLAAVLGGAIGWEREHSRKPAGLRTNVLICLGSALITDVSILAASMSSVPSDPGRIAAQIVTGVGFLGAGTIMQGGGAVTGLTTAATLWVVAAIGMAIGFGAHVEAVGTTVLVLAALIPLRALEAKAGGRRATDRRPSDEHTPSPTDSFGGDAANR